MINFPRKDFSLHDYLTSKTTTPITSDSETALQWRYSDLTLIVCPNMRQSLALLDMVLNFKYLGLKELGVSAKQLRGML